VTDHSSCCGGTHGAKGQPARRHVGERAIEPGGAVSASIASYATRVRPWVNEELVERRARELQAGASYDCWHGLSDRDQELWRHMARLQLAD
jgi:hypothetical protein